MSLLTQKLSATQLSVGMSIITNGLQLYVDIANNRSYPDTGTSVFDLTANDNDMALAA